MRIQHDQSATPTSQIIPSNKDAAEAGGSGLAIYTTEILQVREQTVVSPRTKERNQARDLAEKLIVESEQFKASIEKPAGMSDDDFFHLVCHIDTATVKKIEAGDYVDLEKLLPSEGKLDSEEEMVLRYHNGSTFLGPPPKEKKINSIRKWERAFRIYATIYCRANQSSAGEIWQYIDIINTAAASYTWENVAKYDNIFRKLMAFNPKRSWSITYTQMWTLTMTDPIQKTGFKEANRFKKRTSDEQKRGESDYCWSFNRGYCKYGKNCRYDNRTIVINYRIRNRNRMVVVVVRIIINMRKNRMSINEKISRNREIEIVHSISYISVIFGQSLDLYF